MKKIWVEPRILVQEFVANEYVAACGESGTVYKFECNAGEEDRKYNVYYFDSDGRKRFLASNRAHVRFGYYHPCGTTHEAESDSGFIEGYIDDQDTLWVDEQIKVIIWTDNGTNVHCTTKLDKNTWETTKS